MMWCNRILEIAMTLETDIYRIEEALAAGPTPGPWITDPANPNLVARDGTVYEYVCEVDPSVFAKTDHDDEQCNKDASYIAACDPDAILRLVTIAKLYDQILGALRLAAVLVPHGIDRKIIAAAIDAIVSAKGQKEREPVGKAPVLSNGWRAMVLKGNPPIWVACGIEEYRDAGPMNRRLVPPQE
jgi:hypothetical protein